MLSKSVILLFLSSILLAACSSSNNDTSASLQISEMDLTAMYFDINSNEATQETIEQRTKLVFPFISGHIFGATSDESLVEVTLDNNNQANFLLNDSIFTELTKPEVISIEAANDGLNIDPPDAKFGRIGTFALEESGEYIRNTGFSLYDGKADVVFIVVYFDRPTVLSGVIDEVYNVNIEVSVEGFYAVKVTDEGRENSPAYTLEVFSLSNEVYFALVDFSELQSVASSFSEQTFLYKECNRLRCLPE
jgi:hypothetical protein